MTEDTRSLRIELKIRIDSGNAAVVEDPKGLIREALKKLETAAINALDAAEPDEEGFDHKDIRDENGNKVGFIAASAIWY